MENSTKLLALLHTSYRCKYLCKIQGGEKKKKNQDAGLSGAKFTGRIVS